MKKKKEMGSASCPPAAQGYSRGELQIEIEADLESACFASSERCIYRAPEKLRSRNEEAYTPRVVSIGPFHHGSPRYEAMQKAKRNYLKAFIQRRTPKISIEECLQAAEGWEEPARRCYAEPLPLSRADFIKMLVLDGIFLVEFFFLWGKPELQDSEDPIYGRPWMYNDVLRDIYLLENQLPLFVIKSLFEIGFGRENRDWVTFLGDAIDLHDYSEKAAKVLENPQKTDGIKHILDGVRLCLLPPNLSIQEPADSKLDRIKHILDRLSSIRRIQERADLMVTQDMPTATAMSEAGVKLKPNGVLQINGAGVEFKPKTSKFLDIQYANGVLQIPPIRIDDYTESNFRNLILWEQCHYQDDVSYFTDYVCLMDDLINTTEDVNLLVQKKIVVNWLGENRAVADLFNNACKDIIIDNRDRYSEMRKDLIAHCNRRRNRWRAILMRDYFGNPWATF